MISVCIPLYNGIEFLEETLNSVINQTFKDWECLIGINGHGKDGGDIYPKAKEIVEKFNDNRIRILVFDLKSAPLTINKLVEESKYEWIAHLDADDKWKEDKLQKQVEIIKNNEIDVIGTHCQYFGDKDIIPKLPSGYIDPAFYFYMNPLIHSSVVIRKSLANYTTQFVCYDLDLWLRLFKQDKKIYNISELLTYHRVYTNSYFNASGGQDPRIVRMKYLKDKYTSI